MTRKGAAARRREWEAEREAIAALPEIPEDPARLQGPEVGAVMRYTGRGPHDGEHMVVLERSYVWSPEKRNGAYRGYRNYTWSVVQWPTGARVVVNDSDLQPIDDKVTAPA